jgi:carbamoylphosphate synthase large subunit
MGAEDKWVRSRVPLNVSEALSYARDFGYPVKLAAAFVLGGWRQTANNEEELGRLFREGQNLSPVGEVTLYWKTT